MPIRISEPEGMPNSIQTEVFPVSSMKELLEVHNNNIPTKLVLRKLGVPTTEGLPKDREMRIIAPHKGSSLSCTYFTLENGCSSQYLGEQLTPMKAMTLYRGWLNDGWAVVLFTPTADIDWTNPFLGKVKSIVYNSKTKQYDATAENQQVLMQLTPQGLIDLILSNPTNFLLE